MGKSRVNSGPEERDRRRIESVYRRTLATDARGWLVEDPADAFASSAVATTDTIEAEVNAERDRLTGLARDRNLDVTFAASANACSQLHGLSARPASLSAFRSLGGVLRQAGYERWNALASATQTWVLAGDTMMGVEVVSPGRGVTLGRRVLAKAWRTVDRQTTLGPLLGTPVSLVPELVRFAGVTADDHVVDLGCGDGRLVAEVAQLTGARCTGVELDADLVSRAQSRISGIDRTHVVAGDASAYDLADATVVLLFLPPPKVAEIVPTLLARMTKRSRLVAHEQFPIPGNATDRAVSQVLLAKNAVSVAHRWDVS